MTDRFQSAVSDNEMALQAARETTQRVLQAIADELDKNRLRQRGLFGAPATPRHLLQKTSAAASRFPSPLTERL